MMKKITVQPRTLHSAAKPVRKRIGWNASSHCEVVMHGLMPVRIYTATHPVELSDRLTPDWNPESGEYFCRTYALPVKIGNGCRIGGGAILLPGITIGDGSVIGAGSVVTKDIPPNCVAVGNPCRVLREINKDE